MDRRVVVGLVGIALAGVAVESRGQSAARRDPSAQPSVSLAPIPSIGDSINNTTVISPAVPMAPSAVPSAPPVAGVGVGSPVPRTPDASAPVSLVPMEPIHQSIRRGFGTGAVSSMFRKPAERPAAPVLRTPPRVEPSRKLGGSWVPSLLSGSSTPPQARPAPFANRSPEAPRAQADPPGGEPGAGRPAPFLEELPRAPRPQAAANAPSYRPAETPAPSAGTVALAPEPAAPAPIEIPASAAPDPVAPEPSVLPAPPALPPLAGSELPEMPGPPPALPPAAIPPTAVEAMPALPPMTPVPTTAPGAVDPGVTRTSVDEIAIRTGPVRPRPLPVATRSAATVGDEIITFSELDSAVTEQVRQMTAGQQQGMSNEERRQLMNQVAASILNGMIDQALVIQQARKKMLKNPKAKQMFDEFTEKDWNTQELPPLLRNTASANVHELKVKLAAEGKSYGSMKEAFKKKLMFHEFLRAEIHNKVTSDMIEMKAYYNEHLDQFDQPSRMTWREIEVDAARYPSRAAARQKADEVLARLLRDEDFAALARSVSNGPTASKGGVYVDMQPGSYGIPVVNDELNRIPTGQVSKVLEAPSSFHIVRVDSRREKGPLRFDEVQDKIRGLVLEQNYRKAVDEYLAKLRARTLIRTMFDNTESDPELARRNDPAVSPASR